MQNYSAVKNYLTHTKFLLFLCNCHTEMFQIIKLILIQFLSDDFIDY